MFKVFLTWIVRDKIVIQILNLFKRKQKDTTAQGN